MNLPEKKILRKMGYFRDQRGIANRFLNERDSWQEHLENTRRFILKCAARTREESATILGSGWWLDLPFAELARRFSPLRFVDIVHPPEIRKKAEKYPEIELVEDDLTGGVVRNVFEAVRNRKKESKPITATLNAYGYKPDFNPGFVISVNILSQLDALLTDYWTEFIREDENNLNRFREALQQQHLRFLGQQDSCLISDVAERKQYRNGNVVRKTLLHVGFPQGDQKQSWVWTFDTARNYDPEAVTTLEVQAVCLMKKNS